MRHHPGRAGGRGNGRSGARAGADVGPGAVDVVAASRDAARADVLRADLAMAHRLRPARRDPARARPADVVHELRRSEPRLPPVRGPGQLPPRLQRSRCAAFDATHARVRRRSRVVGTRRAAWAGATARPAHPLSGRVPHTLLPAIRDPRRCRRVDLEDLHRSEWRPPQCAARFRVAGYLGALDRAAADARPRALHGLGRRGRRHGHLSRRPAEHPRAAARGGDDRRRRFGAGPPLHHAATAHAGDPVPAHRQHDRRAADPDAAAPSRARIVGSGHAAAARQLPLRRARLQPDLREPALRLRLGAVVAPISRRARADARGVPYEPVLGPLRGRVVSAALRYPVLLLATAAFSLPTFWVLVTSIKKQSEFNAVPLRLFPEIPQWVNYQLAVVLANFPRYATNSLVLAGSFTILVVATSALVGYGFARQRGPLRDQLFVIVLATMMVPNIVLFVPQFVIFARLELTNTYWPWILWALGGSPFHIFLFRQFFASFPRELEDAAEVDGAGPLRIFLRIFLPNAGPALAASGIFAFLWVWSDWLYPILLLSDENTTLAVRLATAYVDPRGNPLQTVTMAGVVLYALPLVLIFFLAQRFIIKGVVTTGLRG